MLEYWNMGILGRAPSAAPSFHHSIPILFGLAVLLLAVAGGCHQKESTQAGSGAAPPAELGVTIGSLADVARPAPVAVEGYALVGGLAGTGSGHCPPQVRAYFKQYIPTQLPDERVNIDELINSKNTAVVVLEAVIPATPALNEAFDVRVALLAGSEATSLEGGWLYKADLVARGTFGAQTRPLATVEGPVFINSVGTAEIDPRNGYILGGGRTRFEYTALLRLRKPDYRLTSLVRNRLSERYGPGVAQAVSPSDIEVRIPAAYRRRPMRFLALIPATFLDATHERTAARIDTYVNGLTAADPAGRQPLGREASEIALEAIGRQSVAKLSPLLSHPDAEVRLRVGRCLLGLGDHRGLAPLRDLAVDPASPYRLEALDAIMLLAKREDATALGRRLLRDEEVRIVLAAYGHLREMDDKAVTREVIGRSFLLEQVVQSSHKAIFVTRSGEPRVVLFGAPLRCRDNLFVESPEGAVVLDSRPGQGHVSVIRKHPTRPSVIGPIRSGLDVGELIRTLGGEPVAGPSGKPQSVGLSYAQVAALLEQLTAKDAVAAQFWVGPLPKIELGVKK